MLKSLPACLSVALWSAGAFIGGSVAAQDKAFAVKEEPTGSVVVTVGGQPFATYVVDQVNKPYLWPVHGPTGKAMTRAYPMAEVEGEQKDHPHHRGITYGHESAGGASWKFPAKWDGLTGGEKYSGGGDTWHESTTFEEFSKSKSEKTSAMGKARLPTLAGIRHKEYTEVKAEKDHAVIAEICEHVDGAGKRFMTEERRLVFRATADVRIIDFDQDFIATDGPVRFDDRKDAGLSIRVPSSMAVESKQGGRIENSEGIIDDKAWSQAAVWCDYSGPVEGETLGVAILNHPSSFRHPTRWHVRGYGLFTANPFALGQYSKDLGDGTVELKPGERLKLRHRFVFHKGDAKAAEIAAAYAEYAKEPR